MARLVGKLIEGAAILIHLDESGGLTVTCQDLHIKQTRPMRPGDTMQLHLPLVAVEVEDWECALLEMVDPNTHQNNSKEEQCTTSRKS